MGSARSTTAEDSLTADDPLTGYGWDEGFAADFAAHAAQGLAPGRIARVLGTHCQVVTADRSGGLVTVEADLAPVTSPDPLRWACTGDWVGLDAARSSVRALLPRRTAFVRSTSSKRSEGQVLAANIDHAIIAASVVADLEIARIERFLALAWESGAQPLVVLTKTDLVPEPSILGHLVADTQAAAPGVPVLPVSSATGAGLDPLRRTLKDGTSVLLGRSGTGKSTLVNALLGSEVQDVRAARDSDGKGRHTTTSRDLLPLPDGGVVIDTPGLRGVGLWDADHGVAQVFTEIEELARSCRFHDCAHGAEPGCAVLAALERGDLAHRRLESYRKLRRENERIAARSDARLRAEQRRVWKQRQALGRHMTERKRGVRE
ncbi:ribosome small subunit-dependent GTPase A [Streptomyces sp. TP-A0874]|uniref:ribosome small subunit-dependent GTPase A n=1 Tax=Streptomyces sp. TP-A0874 TaxID=549819 RepID=UPI000A5B3D0A|nr:ribosome small subunit-dependent GTPase A [Streptomyces sp. TP-A0874]